VADEATHPLKKYDEPGRCGSAAHFFFSKLIEGRINVCVWEVGNSGGGAIMPAVANKTTFSVNPFGKGIVNNSNHCLSPLYFYDKSTRLSDKGPKMLPDGPRADPECNGQLPLADPEHNGRPPLNDHAREQLVPKSGVKGNGAPQPDSPPDPPPKRNCRLPLVDTEHNGWPPHDDGPPDRPKRNGWPPPADPECNGRPPPND
jgi:hypothetical protein